MFIKYHLDFEVPLPSEDYLHLNLKFVPCHCDVWVNLAIKMCDNKLDNLPPLGLDVSCPHFPSGILWPNKWDELSFDNSLKYMKDSHLHPKIKNFLLASSSYTVIADIWVTPWFRCSQINKEWMINIGMDISFSFQFVVFHLRRATIQNEHFWWWLNYPASKSPLIQLL